MDKCRQSKSGQVMLEYVMAVVIFLSVVLLAELVLKDAFLSYADRTLDLIGSEYP